MQETEKFIIDNYKSFSPNSQNSEREDVLVNSTFGVKKIYVVSFQLCTIRKTLPI
jgi:hypothetical protein